MEQPAALQKPMRIMSGMRTTAALHIGNYHGALKNWLKLQNNNICFFGAMDWHAMTDAYKKPGVISNFTRDIIADWMAWGLDHEKNVIFVQSQVPQHLEIYMILANLTPMGWLERVTTWKDAEEELKAKDAFNLGRFAYPVLQAADILAYRGTHVPVGHDQIPHLELSREIIRRLNHIYKLKLPEPAQLLTETPVLPGSDGRKMSKSYGNVFPLTEEKPVVEKIIKAMPTDTKRARREDVGEPNDCPVYSFHKLYSSEADLQWVQTGCRSAGIGCGDCKGRLSENINKTMEIPRAKKKEILQDAKKLDSIIDAGNQRARDEAEKTLRMIREAMGKTIVERQG